MQKDWKTQKLEIKLKLGKKDQEAVKLAWKLDGKAVEELDVKQIIRERSTLEKKSTEAEEKNKKTASTKWKANMINSTTMKSGWIHKKGNVMNSAVEDEAGVSTNKMEAVDKLRKYWVELWQKQEWQAEERRQKATKIVGILKRKLEGVEIKEGRPDLKTFQASMCKIKGCAGLDGWNREEMKVISKNEGASKIIWQNMAMWESFNCVPNVVNHCKLVHLAKKPLRILGGGQFRPVAILSVWWRAWSSTWIGSSMVRQWTASTFPLDIAGGLPAPPGPELMAALISNKIGSFGHAMTLDCKHAFLLTALT